MPPVGPDDRSSRQTQAIGRHDDRGLKRQDQDGGNHLGANIRVIGVGDVFSQIFVDSSLKADQLGRLGVPYIMISVSIVTP